jgi:hypothetical protein
VHIICQSLRPDLTGGLGRSPGTIRAVEPENFSFSSDQSQPETFPSHGGPDRSQQAEIQSYLQETQRVAAQRDLLAYLKYGSPKYRATLKEVERQEQALVERRRALLRDYPARPELEKLSAWERRLEIVADERRAFATSIFVSGMLMLFAGVSGLLFFFLRPADSMTQPVPSLGVAILGLLLSAATGKHVPPIARFFQVGNAIRTRFGIKEWPPFRRNNQSPRTDKDQK